MQNINEFTEQPVVPSEEDLETYKKVKNSFIDYVRFEDTDSERRSEAKRRFMDDIDYVPVYAYPRLDALKDEADLVTKKTNVYNAVLEIEVARSAAELVGDDVRAAELMLYRSFHDLRLRKIELVQGAQMLHNAQTSVSQEVARSAYANLNAEVYGEMNQDLYTSVLSDFVHKADTFLPQDAIARRVVEGLKRPLAHIHRSELKGEVLLSDETMDTIHNTTLKRYANVLSAVPDSEDDVYYDAEQCVEIINKALQLGNLAGVGWKCVIQKSRTNPSTNGETRAINLPSTTRRNAAELRRLIVHEQEVHARRAENGRSSGSAILQSGTADYADVEEGLGVILECAVAGNLANPSFDRAKERYMVAGLIEGRDGSKPRDAREVYELMWRLIAVSDSKDGTMSAEAVLGAKNKAMSHIDNAFRSTDFWQKGVYYTKLKVYYEGLVKNVQYLKENASDIEGALERAMVGKVNHTDENEMLLVGTVIRNNTPFTTVIN
jgi:hypothetical protein